MEDVFTPGQVGRWLSMSGGDVLELAKKAGVTPRLAAYASSPLNHRWILTRTQVIKILVFYYSRKGASLMRSADPKTASE